MRWCCCYRWLPRPTHRPLTSDKFKLRFKQLEIEEAGLEEGLGIIKELISNLESKEYVLIPLPWGEQPYPKTVLPGVVKYLLFAGALTPEAVPAYIQSCTQRAQEFKKAAKQELQTTEQALSKTKDELSYLLDQRALLKEGSASAQRFEGRWEGASGAGGFKEFWIITGSNGQVAIRFEWYRAGNLVGSAAARDIQL